MLGLVGGTSMVMVIASVVDVSRVRVRVVANLVLISFFSLVSLSNLRDAWIPSRLSEWPDRPTHRRIARLGAETVQWLRQHAAQEFQVRIASDRAWPTAAGLILQLEKKGVQYCVQDLSLFSFGAALKCKQYMDEILIVADRRSSEVVSQDKSFQAIVESSEDSIFYYQSQPEPSVIDFSGPESLLYLKHGFSGIPEIEPGQGRWSYGPSSSLLLPLTPNKPYVLEISARPLSVTDRVQSIRVILNQQQLAEFPMVEREITYAIPFTAKHVRPVNELRFEYAYAEPPMHHLEGSTDWRPLAVFFRRVGMTREK